MTKSKGKIKILALSLIAAFVLTLFSGVFMSESKKAYAAEDSGVSEIYELGNASTYSFKALSGASIDYTTLDDDNARTVGITYGATVALSESYDIIKVEAYLVSKNRNITLENAKYGIKPYKTESTDKDNVRTYNAFFYIYAVGSTVYTIEMTKSDCVLGSKVVYEYSNELNNALSAINATWSENIKPYVIAESDDKIRTRFNFSDYFFNSSLIEDKFSTEESKNEYYKALYSLANSSKIIVGAVTAKVYDNNDNYLCCIYIDLDLKNVPQVTTVESVSIDNDNITM